jgi:hypothetical protein
MDYDRLWHIGERSRDRVRLTADEQRFICDVIPAALPTFPNVNLPRRIEHPAGFAVSGAVVGTFLRASLVLAAQRALGTRYSSRSAFYDRVERDLAFAIMRSHFHRGFPRGVHCCPPCTLAVYPVLKAGAIRYFDCRELAHSVRELITKRQWRFAKFANHKMISWALTDHR